MKVGRQAGRQAGRRVVASACLGARLSRPTNLLCRTTEVYPTAVVYHCGLSALEYERAAGERDSCDGRAGAELCCVPRMLTNLARERIGGLYVEGDVDHHPNGRESTSEGMCRDATSDGFVQVQVPIFHE